MDFTLNNMTLLGITLAVGIVIDDAIVVLENIFRYIEEKQCSPFEAAIQGTREVTLAVMATTLSLVVIFLPIAFMTGYARRYINPFGWTMAFSIMVSMLVSFTLTPMLSSRFLKVADADSDRKTKESRFFHWLDEWYTGWVDWSLDHAGAIIWVSVAVFLLTFPLNRMVGRTFVPDEDMGEWTIHLDAPEGTSLEGTSEMAHQLVKELGNIDGVQDIEPTVTQLTTHLHLLVHAKPFGTRTATQEQMIEEMRRRLTAHPVVPPELHDQESARRRRTGRLPDQREAARTGSQPPDRLLVESVRRGAAAAEPGGSQAVAEHLESRDPRRRRSQAGGRSRRQNGDRRRRASSRRGWRRRDLDLSRGR